MCKSCGVCELLFMGVAVWVLQCCSVLMLWHLGVALSCVLVFGFGVWEFSV